MKINLKKCFLFRGLFKNTPIEPLTNGFPETNVFLVKIYEEQRICFYNDLDIFK